jgi:hypothetical protein
VAFPGQKVQVVMLTVKAMAEVVAWSLMATQMDDLGVPHFRKPPYGSR